MAARPTTGSVPLTDSSAEKADNLQPADARPSPNVTRRSRLRLLVGVLLLLALVYAVEHFIGWGRLLEPWRGVGIAWLLAAIGLVYFSYALRALRIHDYFPAETQGKYARCLKITLNHNLLNNLLPMRSGELSFPLMMRSYLEIPLLRASTALLWFRLMDLLALALIGVAAVGGRFFTWIPALAACVSLVIFLFGFRLLRPALHWLDRRSGEWHTRLTPLRAGLPRDQDLFRRSWAWTLLNWLAKLGVFAALLAVLGEIPPPAAALGAIGGELTSVLPIHGVAGAGSYEAGIVAAMLPYGVPAKTSLAAAVNLHLFLLALTLAGGAVAYWIKGRDDHR